MAFFLLSNTDLDKFDIVSQKVVDKQSAKIQKKSATLAAAKKGAKNAAVPAGKKAGPTEVERALRMFS
eukprot:10512502-Heterocapsa_arctica.AAC.1